MRGTMFMLTNVMNTGLSMALMVIPNVVSSMKLEI